MTGQCPVCGEELNHKITNGYRNWYSFKNVPICTTDDSDTMYVHSPL